MSEFILVLLAIATVIGVLIFIPYYYQSNEKKIAMKWYKIGLDIGFECALDCLVSYDKSSADSELAKKMAEQFNQCEKKKLEGRK